MPAPAIDTNILIENMARYGWFGGAGIDVTYSVPTIGSVWTGYAGGSEPFSADYGVLNASQAARFVEAMEIYDSYLNLTLTETDDLTDPGATRVAFHTDPTNWGYAIVTNSGDPNEVGPIGDVWIATQAVGFDGDFTPGTYNFQSLLHEIGHTLGLGHSFQYSVTPIPPEYENTRYSIMSYTLHADLWMHSFRMEDGNIVGYAKDSLAITPMVFDIFVLQSMCGVDTLTNADDTTYTFDPSAVYLQTIYDAGGVDTWDLSAAARPSIIDLDPGAYSSVHFYTRAQQLDDLVDLYGGANRDWFSGWVLSDNGYEWVDNVGIAYGVTIENATLGANNDRATGNDAANELRGNGGNDVLSGMGGIDTLLGGAGNDDLNGGVGADVLRGEAGDDLYRVDNVGDSATEDVNAGVDTVVASRSWAVASNIEKVILSGSGDFNVAGNGLANTLKGNGGDNWINGSFGKDTLTGGAGRDSFIFNRTLGPNNIDTITDYDVVRDVIRIDNAVFTGIGAAGALAAGMFNTGAAATQADDRIIYDQTTGKLFFDIDGAGGARQTHFATLSTKPTGMSAGEFIII